MSMYDKLSLYPQGEHLNRVDGRTNFLPPPDDYYNLPDETVNTKTANEYLDKFQRFYVENYILISVVQWLVIFYILIKLSKK